MNDTLFILAIVELVLKYGVPGALQVISDWNNQDPTIEDIEALRKRVPKPGTYFKEGKND